MKTNKDLLKECKQVYRQLLLAKWGNKCLRCSKLSHLQISHIYPVGKYRKLELDPDNALPLCDACHLWFFHKNPLDAADWIKQTVPKKQLDRLELRKGQSGKGSKDYKLWLVYLKNELATLLSNKVA